MPRIPAISLLLVALATGAWAQMTDEEAKAVADYPLTMEHVQKVLKASNAISRLVRADLGLSRELDAIAREARLDQQVRRLESNPKVLAELRPLGLTPKDFCFTLKALSVARMASVMPPKLPHPGASADHIKFYRDHQDEIEKLEEDSVPSPAPSPTPH